MLNPFGDTAIEENPFKDTPVGLSVNPLGDQEVPTASWKETGKGIVRNILPQIQLGVEGLKLGVLKRPEEGVVSRAVGGVTELLAPTSPLAKVTDRIVQANRPKLNPVGDPEDIAFTENKIRTLKNTVQANTPEGQTEAQRLTAAGSQSVAENVVPLVASILLRNPTPAIVAGSLSTAGRSLAEDLPVQENGESRTSYENAVKNASVKGLLEGALGAYSVGGLLKDLGHDTFVKVVGKFILREEVTEIPTDIGQNIADRVFANPNQPFKEFLQDTAKSALDTAIITPFSAGGTATIAKGVTMPFERKEEKKAEVLKQTMQENVDRLQKSAADALTGIVQDELAPRHSDIPAAPLTPEELQIAAVQLKNLETRAALPPHPEAQADIIDLDQKLQHPAYKQAEAAVKAAEDMIQSDLDRNISLEVAERRATELFPMHLPPSQRPIAWSSEPTAVGLGLEQTPLRPGQVVVLSADEAQFSPAYTKALGETINKWAKVILPTDARIIINLSGLTGDAVGGYQQLASGIHVISPRELVRAQGAERLTPVGVELEKAGKEGYNTFTQQQTFYALTHEFGHALVMSRFAEQMPELHRNIVGRLDTGATYTEEELATMPAPEAAVVREYQQRKLAILERRLSAQEMTDVWLGTWKLGKDLMKKQSRTLYSHAQAALKKDAEIFNRPELSSTDLSQVSALDLIHALGRNTSVSEANSNAAAEAYYLQFNEYMAEQFSRYAYANRIDQGTALGIYFKKALDILRNFFKSMKSAKGVAGEAVIKPGVSFQEWVDQMGRAKALQELELRGRREKKVAKAKKAKAGERAAIVADLEGLSKRLSQENNGSEPTILQELTDSPEVRDALKERVRVSLPNTSDPARAEIFALIAKGRLLEAEDILIDVVSERIRKDVKEAGGQWEPGTLGKFDSLADAYLGTDDYDEAKAHGRKLAKAYLNKYAGTVKDPLRNLQVPYGDETISWGEIMESLLFSSPASQYAEPGTPRALVTLTIPGISKALPDEPIYRLDYFWDAKGRKNIGYITPEGRAMQDYLAHVSDFLVQETDAGRGVKVARMDFVRLMQETAAWDKKMAEAAAKKAAEGLSLEGTENFKQYPDGMQWVKVVSDTALEAEGEVMGHCVGAYCARVSRGDIEIYSLRDSIGFPHVTIEVSPAHEQDDSGQIAYPDAASIKQIKGKGNKKPVSKYIPYVQDFVQSGTWAFVDDIENAELTDVRYIAPATHMEEWLGLAKETFGASTYRTKAEIGALNAKFAEEILKREAAANPEYKGPYLDKGSKDSEEVRVNAARLGIFQDSIPWQKAMNFVKDAQHYILQVQQIAHSSSSLGVHAFVDAQNRLQALKNNLMAKGTDVAKRWEDFSKAENAQLQKILLDELHSGGHVTELVQDTETGIWTHKGGLAFKDYLKARGVDSETPEGAKTAQLILDIKNSILEHVQAVENGALDLIKSTYHNAPLVMQKKANEIRELTQKWRVAPYVPHGHYGDYVVKVFETGEEGRKILVHTEHFETAAEQDAAVKKFHGRVGSENVKWFKIPEKGAGQLTLPLDFLEVLKDTGEFTDSEIGVIGQAMVPLRGEKAFSKFERDASTLSGADPDMLKNYANWLEDSANFTAKWIYSRKMTQARAHVRAELNEARVVGDVGNARELQRVLDTLARAQDFITHPQAEWFQARSVIALTYLMYAPKTALMNATGIIQTFAAATQDFGEVAGTKYFTGAVKDLVNTKFGVALPGNEQAMLDHALKAGIIDQGFGYFMSGLAEAGTLQRRLRPTVLGKLGRGFVDTGMYMFKAVEEGNRRITLLAMYRGELDRRIQQGRQELGEDEKLDMGMLHESAVAAAEKKTRLLQNDYSSGNRPALLTGKKSIFMIFLSYPQYMLWIMSGGYERGMKMDASYQKYPNKGVSMTLKMWLVFLAASGVEGVPFGEAILELLQRMWKLLGKGENVRVEGQKFLKETVGIESMYWRRVVQRGFLHDTMGVDLSGSYSLGSPVPGLGLINPNANTWREFIGEAFEEFSGPFGGVAKGAVGLGLSEDVGMKELGKTLPAAAGSIARAITASEQGLKTAKGERVLKDAEGNFRTPTGKELALIALGFRLTDLANFQQVENLKRQQAEYWNGRRILLKHQFRDSFTEPTSREAILKAIAQYNTDAPTQGLRLTGKELHTYVKAERTRIRNLEINRDPRRTRELNQNIEKTLSEE